MYIKDGQQIYKSYIGFTKSSIEHRFSENNTWCGHFYRAFVLQYNSKFYCALRKYGKEAFRIRELEDTQTTDVSYIKSREVFWISYYNSYIEGYNMTPGGDGSFYLSEETRRKISKKLKSRKWSEEQKTKYRQKMSTPEATEKRHKAVLRQWETHRDTMMASRQSNEYRQKMSKISTEVRQRPEFKEKMRNIMQSQEYKDKMSASLKAVCQTKEYKERQSIILKEVYKNNDELRQTVSRKVKEAVNKPDVKEKHRRAVSEALKDTRVMNDGYIIKYIKLSEVDNYLKRGWSFGRLKKQI